MKKIKNILVVYKKSAYKIYFQERSSSLYKRRNLFDQRLMKNFRQAHAAHYGTLEDVARVLKRHGIPYKMVCRGRKIDYRLFDFVISVGGDGTFFEAARNVTHQRILGVNSDPARSIGKFCSTNRDNFFQDFDRIRSGKGKTVEVQRFKIQFQRDPRSVNVVNDALICHLNPASMSRYRLSIGKMTEDQRSSGLWISTASGSSGAIRSAGGKVLPWTDKRFQYKPRELHRWWGVQNRLTGGLVALRKPIVIQSYMRQGIVCVDGEHLRCNFGFGETIKISKTIPLKITVP